MPPRREFEKLTKSMTIQAIRRGGFVYGGEAVTKRACRGAGRGRNIGFYLRREMLCVSCGGGRV
jgi:hypothetical protein